jgi:hypothetical protein
VECDPDIEEWLSGVSKTMNELRQSGVTARRVDVDVKELADWCRERGRPLDGEARSMYAVEQIESEHDGT